MNKKLEIENCNFFDNICSIFFFSSLFLMILSYKEAESCFQLISRKFFCSFAKNIYFLKIQGSDQDGEHVVKQLLP